ncbi:hypothetical protein GCM10017600_57560 [Streptosporangium carneum]|uniref:Uncharacterized protein n=1 Tax=Streptosporangium carneum TaxID=47481 RepID=A0A9W6I5E2_9ACTN|nr:hypothetical protein GCM10017600_57560 [Streptosporangium carneum]
MIRMRGEQSREALDEFREDGRTAPDYAPLLLTPAKVVSVCMAVKHWLCIARRAGGRRVSVKCVFARELKLFTPGEAE